MSSDQRNSYDGTCCRCGHQVPAGTGSYTSGRRGAWGIRGRASVYHLDGECPDGPPLEIGVVYAVTGMGPLYDLIKVGSTMRMPGEHLFWRPSVVVVQEQQAFAGREVCWKDSFQPSRIWAARTADRLQAEHSAHCLLDAYRIERPLVFDRFGGPRKSSLTPEERDVRFSWKRKREAALRLCTAPNEMFRADIGVVLEVLATVTGNPTEGPL
jgi:hypothetical protein